MSVLGGNGRDNPISNKVFLLKKVILLATSSIIKFPLTFTGISDLRNRPGLVGLTGCSNQRLEFIV